MAQAPLKATGQGMAELKALRCTIDALDSEIVRLVNQRAATAMRIGAIKDLQGLKPYSAARELQVYHKVAAQNGGPLSNQAFQAIYREIMSATIALERPTRVAFAPGPAGTFAHLAARTKFGASVEYTPMRDIRDVFLAVARGRADYGVVPIENSTEGGINQSIDMFAETRLKIASEIYLPIHQHLISRSPLRDIRIIYSHPQPFAQCRNWLLSHLGEVERREVGSTATAVKLASKERHAAAIGGALAAEILKMPIVASNLEDATDNTTRFLVVAEHSPERTGKDKTSLLLVIHDQTGALLRLLQPFFRHKINLTRIESRPNKRRPWEYNFYLDLEGHVEDPAVRMALQELDGTVKHLEVLGSYPAAERRPAQRKKVK